jgi:Domain of unknown function (DUF2935)
LNIGFQVLGDHARFILDSLSPREKTEVERANGFVHVFDLLLAEARQPLTEQEAMRLSRDAEQQTHRLREFKLHLLRRHLTSQIGLLLPPTFMNHMVNELEEYQHILEYLVRGETPPPAHPVHHHVLWLADALGHSETLESMVDPVEKQVIAKSHQFTRRFEGLYLKALEVAGYLRTRLGEFPALTRFNQDVSLEVMLFREFLKELEDMKLDASLLSTLSPLLPDHMAREECYYLLKLAQSSDVPAPPCDPAAPRVQE